MGNLLQLPPVSADIRFAIQVFSLFKAVNQSKHWATTNTLKRFKHVYSAESIALEQKICEDCYYL